MNAPVATNFNDCVAVMAANSPHGTVMDWWRRLDLTLRDYACLLMPSVDARNRDAIEGAISRGMALGRENTRILRELRQLRNRVAHEQAVVSSDDAISYARQAFDLIGAVAKRISELEDPA